MKELLYCDRDFSLVKLQANQQFFEKPSYTSIISLNVIANILIKTEPLFQIDLGTPFSGVGHGFS